MGYHAKRKAQNSLNFSTVPASKADKQQTPEKHNYGTFNQIQKCQASESMTSGVTANQYQQQSTHKKQRNPDGFQTREYLNLIPVTNSSVKAPAMPENSNYRNFIGTQRESIRLCSCGMKFGNRDTRNAHMRYFAANQNFSCDVCRIKFSSYKAITIHMRKAHQILVNPKHVACNICGVIFANGDEYRKHLSMIYDRNLPAVFPNRVCPWLKIKHYERKAVSRCNDTTIAQPPRAPQVASVAKNRSPESIRQLSKSVSPAPVSMEQYGEPLTGSQLTAEQQTLASAEFARTNFNMNGRQHSGNHQETQSLPTITPLFCIHCTSEGRQSNENVSADSTKRILNEIQEFWLSVHESINRINCT